MEKNTSKSLWSSRTAPAIRKLVFGRRRRSRSADGPGATDTSSKLGKEGKSSGSKKKKTTENGERKKSKVIKHEFNSVVCASFPSMSPLSWRCPLLLLLWVVVFSPDVVAD